MDRDERRLAAVYRIHGKDAIYVAPADPAPVVGDAPNCRIQFFTPQPDQRPNGVALGETFGLAAKPWAILVRSSQVEDPVVDGRFYVLAGATYASSDRAYRIGEAPIPQDALGREWRCATDL